MDGWRDGERYGAKARFPPISLRVCAACVRAYACACVCVPAADVCVYLCFFPLAAPLLCLFLVGSGCKMERLMELLEAGWQQTGSTIAERRRGQGRSKAGSRG